LRGPSFTSAVASDVRESSFLGRLNDIERRNPEGLALLAPDRGPITFSELLSSIEHIGRRLTAHGINNNDRVAVVLRNGPEMAAALLGVASVATCAPLNHAYGSSEFEFYLRDLRARALLVRPDLDSPAVEVARTMGIEVLMLPDDGELSGTPTLESAQRSSSSGSRTALSEDVALVLHTSGTTSRPKIVPLTHANLCASIRNVRDALGLLPADRCLNMMPLFHIHGLVAGLLASLSAGASVVCAPGFSASEFFSWLEQCRPTWYTAVPTMHQAILALSEAHRETISRCPVRLIRSSSSALPPRVAAGLERVFEAPVIEAYGMTEAAHQIASNPLPPGVRKPGTVGLAAGPRVAVMDVAGVLLPAGTVGEIVIAGENLTRGYENDPDANRSAFVDGWFRTGDQGILDEDGYLTISGRLKEIINKGGEKVSPREIDEVLLGHPAVHEAVTFATAHPTLGEEIAAAVVLRPGAQATESELRAFANGRLAYFKIPSRIIVLEEIPKGSTGKVQRVGLADRLAEHLKSTAVAPRNSLEEALAVLYSELLGLASIGIDDHFFHAGGDSMKATQLLARVRKEFDVDLPPSALFEAPTIRELGSVIGRFRHSGHANAVPSITAVRRNSGR
jgi:acyl-CoA synthetase (AMP-forming)/AMP-acid ligase II/acyl carrier protein